MYKSVATCLLVFAVVPLAAGQSSS